MPGQPPSICAGDHIPQPIASQVRLGLFPREPDHPLL
jgi:hypothetical protein